MIDKEKILNKHSQKYGDILDNPRAVVLATEALEAMKELEDQLLSEITNEEIEKWAMDDIPKHFNTDDTGPVVNIAYYARIKGAKWMYEQMKKRR